MGPDKTDTIWAGIEQKRYLSDREGMEVTGEGGQMGHIRDPACMSAGLSMHVLPHWDRRGE
jgi:hypothetical protein